MKGLFYKEFYFSKKLLLINLAAVVGFWIIGILIKTSTVYGNLAKLDGETIESLNATMFYIFTFGFELLFVRSLTGDNSRLIGDFKCSWNLFSYTLPVSSFQFAAIKYIMCIVGMIVSFGLSLINALLFGALCGQELTLDILKIMTMVLILLTALCASEIPMSLKLRTQKAVMNRQVLIGSAFYFAVAAVFGMLTSSYKENHPDDPEMTGFTDSLTGYLEKIFDALFRHSPLIIVCFLAVGFMRSVRLYNRRDK